VPGGLEFAQVIYLIKNIVQSGRTIIGFDLSEVGGEGNEWDGNVAARLLYKLCNFTGRSNGKI
jgi:agmatinase